MQVVAGIAVFALFFWFVPGMLVVCWFSAKHASAAPAVLWFVGLCLLLGAAVSS